MPIAIHRVTQDTVLSVMAPSARHVGSIQFIEVRCRLYAANQPMGNDRSGLNDTKLDLRFSVSQALVNFSTVLLAPLEEMDDHGNIRAISLSTMWYLYRIS